MFGKRQPSILLNHRASGATIYIAFIRDTRGSDHLKASHQGCFVKHHGVPQPEWEEKVLICSLKQVLSQNW
jgi:hypothetical protein